MPLTTENQRKILDEISRLFGAIGTALDRESCGYEEGISLIREYGNRTLFDLLLVFVERTLPVVGQEHTLTAESIPVLLDAMSTRQKAKKILASSPDPDPAKLERILREVHVLLPSIRKILVPFAKQLPPAPGGHPRKFQEQEEPRVREEVAQLFNAGFSLPAAKKEVARRRRTSLSTIQRVCRKGTLKKNIPDGD
jgi:hypothetical protein